MFMLVNALLMNLIVKCDQRMSKTTKVNSTDLLNLKTKQMSSEGTQLFNSIWSEKKNVHLVIKIISFSLEPAAQEKLKHAMSLIRN